MKLKLSEGAALKVIAVALTALVVMLTPAQAATVSIVFGGATQATTNISPTNLINKQVKVVHRPEDITWSDVKVQMSISSATLAKSLERIFVFKCKLADPATCVRGEPLEFDTFVDTELSWRDIAQQKGSAIYPQVANLMVVAKLKDRRDTWTGLQFIVERTDFNKFNVFNYEIAEVELVAKSANLVNPIKSFIDKHQMVPFEWVSEATFKSASPLYSVGGSSDELSGKDYQSATLTNNKVNAISKDYFLIYPNTTSGIANPVTLHRNPSFRFGDGLCESDLGETSQNSCSDCGCASGLYCDVQPDKSGSCRDESQITMDVLPLAPITITDCTRPAVANLTARITNPPSSLRDSATGIANLGGQPQSVSCTRVGPDTYICPSVVQPNAACGLVSNILSPNTLRLVVNFKDGGKEVTKALDSQTFPPITVNINCNCPAGFYCDSGIAQCRSEASISISVLSVRSFIPDFNPAGDIVDLTVKVNNPPSDLTVTGETFVLGNITSGTSSQPGYSGDPACTGGASTNHVYQCQVPLTITPYENTRQYVVRNNSITFDVQYSSAGVTRTQSLFSRFSDVTVPPSTCGDNICGVNENSANCCFDCGCTSGYCDSSAVCKDDAAIDLELLSTGPTSFSDCRVAHEFVTNLRVLNKPTDARINFVFHRQNVSVTDFPVTCQPLDVNGITACVITIPVQDQNRCKQSLPNPFLIGSNKIEMNIGFTDGRQQASKTLIEDLPDVTIAPTFKHQDGLCETDVGEAANVSCDDCITHQTVGCVALGGQKTWFCNAPDLANPEKTTCLAKEDIRLRILSPTSTVELPSCEKRQSVSVLADIENKPSDAKVGGFWADINGRQHGRIFCRELGAELGFSQQTQINTTFNCSISLDPQDPCSQGSTFRFDNNSLNAVISYNKGKITQQISGTLPPIVMTQKIRSIFDIIQDLREDAQEQIDNLNDVFDQMLDWLDTCQQLATILLTLALIGGIAGGVYVGFTSGGAALGTFALGFGGIVTGLGGLLSNTCNMIQKRFEIEAEIINLQFERLRMQTCLELHQHIIDDGQCRGDPQAILSCYEQMRSCINFGSIGSGIQSVSGAFNQFTGSFQQFGQNLQQIGQGFTQISPAFGVGGVGAGSLRVTWNDGLPGDRACNKDATLAQLGVFGRRPRADWITIQVTAGPTCNYPAVYDVSTTPPTLLCTGTSCRISIDQEQLPRTMNMGLFCFINQQDFAQRSADPPASLSASQPLRYHIGVDLDNNGICEGNEMPSGSGGITTASQKQQADSLIGAARNEIDQLQGD